MAKFEYMQRAFSSELKPRARLVLQVLVLHCNKEGECFPSIKTISTKTGYKLLKDGKIEYLKIGRAYRIPKAHILRYLKITCATVAE